LAIDHALVPSHNRGYGPGQSIVTVVQEFDRERPLWWTRLRRDPLGSQPAQCAAETEKAGRQGRQARGVYV